MKKLATMMFVILCALTGISKAQYGGLLGLKVDSIVTMSPFASLFREAADSSKIQQTFQGSVCAKGRVTPEYEDFFDATGLILEPQVAGLGAVEYDSRKIEGVQSTKLNDTGASGSLFACDISPALNWKHKSIKFRFYIPPTDHNILQIDLRLFSEGTQYNYTVWNVTRRSPRTGWIEYSFTPTNGYSLGDLVAVDGVTIKVLRQNNALPGYILVNGLTVWDGRLKMPLYCCTFDDNYIRQYEAAVYAISKGIPVSLFINKNYSDGIGVAGSSEGMTLAQNQALAKAGCIHINHSVGHSPTLWSNPNASVDDLIADIENNRQWMDQNGLGFGAGIFGSPQEWWLQHHEDNLKSHMFGRPRQGKGMGSNGLLTMWDENTEIRSANDTHLEYAYQMLRNNVGTLLWTPGNYPLGALREWTDGNIYEVTNASGTSQEPLHPDWNYV